MANLIATAAAFEQANARVVELFRRAEREIPVSIHGASGRTVAQGAGLSPVWDSNYLRTVPRSLENPQENGRDAIFAEAFRFDPSLLAETDPVRIRAEAHRKFDRELAERADSERLARQKFMESAEPPPSPDIWPSRIRDTSLMKTLAGWVIVLVSLLGNDPGEHYPRSLTPITNSPPPTCGPGDPCPKVITTQALP